jgi:GntR family galactonate operon transcriptional repressor
MMHRVIRGEFVPGSVLPTEPALGEEFGFSRTVVREALRQLEERGLVRIEQGRGTTVQSRVSWNLLDPLVLRTALVYDENEDLLDDLIRVRRLLEGDMARTAPANLTADELADLEQSVQEMEAAYDDYPRFRSFDLAFHAIIMRASGSEIGYGIVRAIHLHGGARPQLSSAASREALERTVSDHWEIYEALKAGDGELAAARIVEHIETAWAERRSRRPS